MQSPVIAKKLCEVSLAKLVDAHNFADILAYGEAFNWSIAFKLLQGIFALNLDAILVAARPRELSILRFQTSVGMVGSEHEEQLFDFIEEYFQEESPRLHPKPPPLPVPTQQAKNSLFEDPYVAICESYFAACEGDSEKINANIKIGKA